LYCHIGTKPVLLPSTSSLGSPSAEICQLRQIFWVGRTTVVDDQSEISFYSSRDVATATKFFGFSARLSLDAGG